MWRQMTFEDLTPVTSSPELAGGRSPCVSLDGQTIGPSGPEAAPVNRTPQPESDSPTPIPATSGRRSSGSSASAALSSALASRLKGRFGTGGLMEYRQTWKEKATPLGRSYLAHIASARPTSDSDYSGWPTPRVTTNSGHGNGDRAMEGSNSRLEDTAQVAGWATPQANDAEKRGQVTASPGRQVCLPAQSQLAGWASPTAQDGSRGGLPPRPHDTGVPLSQQAVLAGWSTPDSKPDRPNSGSNAVNLIQGLGNQAKSAITGTDPCSSPVETARRGVLNPALSAWLMGYPSAWLMAAPVKERAGRRCSKASGTRSSRKSQPSS